MHPDFANFRTGHIPETAGESLVEETAEQRWPI